MQLTREDPIQLVRVNGSVDAYADLSDGFLRLIVIEGDYDEEFFRVAGKLLSGKDTFFDVGANFGLLSFGLAGKEDTQGVRCHLFEPNSRLIEVIRRSLERFPGMDASIQQVAVSDHDGELPIAFHETQSGASHFDPDAESRVPCITLDRYAKDEGVERVELLKLDVEGHELAALQGTENLLKDKQVGAIYFEYFEKNLSPHHPPSDLLEYLESLGYVVCLCRTFDLGRSGGATHFVEGSSKETVEVRPIDGNEAPAQTDLLAVEAHRLKRL